MGGDSYSIIAVIVSATGQYVEPIAVANRAIILATGSAGMNAIGGLALYQCGDGERGLEHMLIGLRLEPNYPNWLPGALYPALLEMGRYDEAISLARSVLKSENKSDVRAQPLAKMFIAVGPSLKGDMNNARKATTEMKRCKPDVNVEFLMECLKRNSPRPLHQAL